jgi:hypothetical protein
MMSEQRIAELEQQIGELRLEVAGLRRQHAPSPRREESRVRISSPPLSNVALPTEDEFRRLLHVVLERYPVLKLREDPADYAAQFRSAFIRLAHCGRRDTVDSQRGLGFWLDDCQEWCRRHQVNPGWIGGAPFTAAVIAHGDIRFVFDDWPHDTAFALQFGGGGIPSGDWWKRVLGGAILGPVPPRYPTKAPSPARVHQMAMEWRK